MNRQDPMHQQQQQQQQLQQQFRSTRCGKYKSTALQSTQ
jgi:hypothetical protein